MSSGYTYNWSNGATTQDISNLSAGEYTCTISDDFSCESTITKIVENNTGTLEVNEIVHNDNCETASGYINLTVSGATNYSVIWNTGATTDNLTDLAAGDYSVTVINDDTNCEYNGSFSIETVGLYSLSEIITNSSCETCNDGAIDLSLTPDTYTFSYNWSNSETTQDITGLLAGYYSVIVNNEFGCEQTGSYSIGFVGIRNPEMFDISIYPNPIKDILNIKYSFLNNEKTSINIYNMLGKLIYQDIIKDKEGIKQINTSVFKAGVYFVKIGSDKNFKTFRLYKKY